MMSLVYSFRLISHSVGNLNLQNVEVVSKAVCLGQSLQDDVGSDNEPYTSEKLSTIPGGYRALTPVFKVMEFDFQDYKVRRNLLKSHLFKCRTLSGNFKASLLSFWERRLVRLILFFSHNLYLYFSILKTCKQYLISPKSHPPYSVVVRLMPLWLGLIWH